MHTFNCVAGLEAVQKELGGGPSSDDAAAAGVTVAVTSGTSLWASLAPGWQPLMNVYKHRFVLLSGVVYIFSVVW